MTREQAGIEKAQRHVKRDNSESLFEREAELLQDKKELAKDRLFLDAQVRGATESLFLYFPGQDNFCP